MSIVLQGWGSGAPFAPLTQGYGAGAPVLVPGAQVRETFVVPTPDGDTGLRHGLSATGQPPYIGSLESGIAFALDFRPWLGITEALAALSVTATAFPGLGHVTPYDATATLIQGTAPQGGQAVVTLHNATAETAYVITVAATTTAGRVLECRMPRLWCPD